MDNDLIVQCFQYLLGIIPGDVAGNIVAVLTTMVTIFTLIMRFWKIPDQASQSHKLWKLIYILASLKTPSVTKVEAKDGQKIN
ncbi:unnamed protein product [Commensalibacter communis]|uniref:hypothetical protein n=1 Tax=Commensalibacter communis TaxID=2972786 RepID=UPI0022FF946F|nr:hypothetical protein [Commensalibacter communis]CAI3956167.1 unnamed protein product [Commensalibacter communis]CAI3956953.1 unnamed protein product [Commensalibacter communis]